MNKAENRNWSTFALCVFAIMTVLVIVSFFVPLYGEICVKDEYTGTKECTPYHLVLYLAWCALRALDAGGVAITAIATIAIGAFTYQLKSATVGLIKATDRLWTAGEKQFALVAKQLDLSEKSHALARHEFFATHRPELLIRRIAFEKLADGLSYKVQWTVANCGRSDCLITGSNATLAYLDVPLPQIPPYDGENNDFGSNTALKSGASSVFYKLVKISHSEDTSRRLSEYGAVPKLLHFFGNAKYEDALGNERNIGFCFHYNNKSHRFDEVEDPNYKYYE